MRNEELRRKIYQLEESRDDFEEEDDTIQCLQKAIRIMQEEIKRLNKEKDQKIRKRDAKIRALWKVAFLGRDDLPDNLTSKTTSEIESFKSDLMQRIEQEIDDYCQRMEEYNQKVLEGRDTEDDDF